MSCWRPRRAGARWRILHVTCADAVAEERLARSDPAIRQRIAILRSIARIKQHFEPIQHAKLEVDTHLGHRCVLAVVEAYLTGGEEALR